MKTQAKRKFVAALAAFLATVTASFAITQALPTPPPSPHPDTESSVNVPLPDWPALGRRVSLTLTVNATPSNNVQIAFGQDTNADGNLAPEETALVLGVDCGTPFIRDEVEVVGGGGQRWFASASSGEAVSSPLVSEYPPAQQPEGAARRGDWRWQSFFPVVYRASREPPSAITPKRVRGFLRREVAVRVRILANRDLDAV